MQRKTIDRKVVTHLANRRLERLAKSGTKEDADRRHELVCFVSQLLLDGNSYQGFRYLNPPTISQDKDGNAVNVWDETRVHFN